MFGALRRQTVAAGRSLFKQPVARSHGHGGVPGENLPFGIENRLKLTLYFALFFGSGLSVPYLAVRHQLLKQ